MLFLIFFFSQLLFFEVFWKSGPRRPNVEQFRLLQLIVLYSKERRGVFSPKVKCPTGGSLPPEHRAEVRIRAVTVTAVSTHGHNRSRASSACQGKRQIAGFFQILSIYLWAWMTLPLSRWVLKALPFLYLRVFSCVSSFEQRNISNTQLCRDKPSVSQACVGLGGAGAAGVFSSLVMGNLYFSWKRCLY